MLTGWQGSAVSADDLLGERVLVDAVDLMIRLVEAAGALIIFVGAMFAFGRFVIAGVRTRRTDSFTPVRLGLGRFLVLGLEFQLASDILRTAITPTLRQIGELAGIVAIRTALNYFLGREIKEEREELARGQERAARGPGEPERPARGGQPR